MKNTASSRVLRWLLLAGILLALGLVRETLLFRSNFDPNYPQDLTDFVEARGFPFAWWVVGRAELLELYPWWRRLLVGRFLLSAAFASVAAFAALRAWRRWRPNPGFDPRMGRP